MRSGNFTHQAVQELRVRIMLMGSLHLLLNCSHLLLVYSLFAADDRIAYSSILVGKLTRYPNQSRLLGAGLVSIITTTSNELCIQREFFTWLTNYELLIDRRRFENQNSMFEKVNLDLNLIAVTSAFFVVFYGSEEFLPCALLLYFLHLLLFMIAMNFSCPLMIFLVIVPFIAIIFFVTLLFISCCGFVCYLLD